MTISSIWSTRVLLGTTLACSAAIHAGAQQQPVPPVPITNDTPAATSKAMPPETTPVQGTASAPLTKGQMKAQRKQQKADEKAAESNAKAAKSTAKAKKQSNKAIQDQEKAARAASQVPPPSN